MYRADLLKSGGILAKSIVCSDSGDGQPLTQIVANYISYQPGKALKGIHRRVATLERILNLLESFRGKAQVQRFLQQKQIAYSGTWATVREKIDQGLTSDKITQDELIALLEDIEEHGDQYIYLYDLDVSKAPRIKDRASFEELLTQTERDRTLDKVAVIENPSRAPTLVSSHYSEEQLKLKWVQKRSFRRPLGETIEGNVVTVRYQIVDTRAVDLVILDFAERRAIFCIQKVEPGVRDYKKQLQELFNRLARFVDPDAFTPLDLHLLMKRIDGKSFHEIRRRRYRALDANGGLIDVTSPTESEDIYDGGLYEVGRDNYTGAVASLHVNAYWVPVEKKLEREIHTIFPYKQAVNAVVFTQRCLKSERNYVLSRIETIARGKP